MLHGHVVETNKMSMVSARFILHSLFFLFAIVLALVSIQTYAYALGSSNDRDMPVIAASALPLEGRETLHLIKQGGPFLYARDGMIFSNFEKRLPKRERGYYHEYTVKTPGVRNRGARRIVCGQPVECYYSADHYRTFRRIIE
ncbi:Guanyl-specific ribonuclease Sa3 [Candidatus Nitrotoga sp. BS]|nr:Guanyl-specific ribonuclease Sa3 [Candidatus Nitrotoga sp. BS]